MASSFLCVKFVLCVIWASGFHAAQNVDYLEPLVKISPAVDIDELDGFGWTAVLHQVDEVLSSDSMSEALAKTRVIVGAPRGTFPGGLNLTDPELPAIDRTGLVYSCPVGIGDCEGVRGDTDRYIGAGVSVDITNGFQTEPMSAVSRDLFTQAIAEGRLFDQAPDSEANGGLFSLRQRVERKENQLMGSFLYSNGDNILACAPRWVTNAFVMDGSQPRGICFVGTRNLTSFKTQYPCVGDGSSISTLFSGYCSAGLSATIVGGQIIIGAIGYEESSGAVFSRDLSASITSPFTETINHLNENVVRSERHAAYYGFQVTHGYITSNDRSQDPPDILVGSPRDDETMYIGRIYLYSINTLGSIQDESLASGMQMGEFFGHSIVLCDLTGDGYDELLVGAPMYTALSPLSPEQGRLYVFFNTGGSLDLVPLIIEGRMAGSRFGFTIANLGDIDRDGHEDFAVSAPYESSSTTLNTGAIYIYYGRDTKEEFGSQLPQKVHADAIVDSTDSLALLGDSLVFLRTFGFSLSGNVDVDNNQYNDLVAGGYLDQAVVILRTLPVVNITVDFDAVPDVHIDVPEPSFEVTVRASYVGIGVPGPLRIPFTLSEAVGDGDSRLYFTIGDTTDSRKEDTILLLGPDMIGEQTVTVYAMVDITDTRPYELELQLNEIVRDFRSSYVSDLSSFPRTRLQGNTTRVTVNVINPCGNDGCQSDVVLTVPTANTTLIQGQERRNNFPLSISNMGLEEARTLVLTISGFPNTIFQQVTLSPDNQAEVAFSCVRTDSSGIGTVICPIQSRFYPNQNLSATLTMVPNSRAFIGNEAGFDVVLSAIVDTMDNNSDINAANNEGILSFSFGSQSDINLAMSFGRERYSYDGQIPTSVQSSFDLGGPVTLLVRVDNVGPSTIQNAVVNVSFPSQISLDTSQYFLYPSRITGELLTSAAPSADTLVNCSSDGIDPLGLNSDDEFTFQPSASRSKRSLIFAGKAKRVNSVSRAKRQSVDSANTINCDTHACVTVRCDIQRLTTDGISLTFEFNIDERYFGSLSSRVSYSINAVGSVSVTDNFQSTNDVPSDNLDTASTVLVPVETERVELLHVILWPTVGAFILLILFVLLLYFCGFFRRKKPEDGEDISSNVEERKPNDEITGL